MSKSRKTLSQIAQEENSLDTLRELRATICSRIESTTDARALGPLSRQLMQIIEKIDEIKAADDSDDEINQIIRKREAEGAPGAVRPPRR